MSETPLNADAAPHGPENLELTPDDPLEVVFAPDIEPGKLLSVEDRNYALIREPSASPAIEHKSDEAL